MTTANLEKRIINLFAADRLSKYNATKLLNKCMRVFNNASDQLEAITDELTKLLGE